MTPASTLFVGIGSPHGDDQIGWLIADRVAARAESDVSVQKAKSPIELLNWLDGRQRLIVCDACRGLGLPGSRRRWTWPSMEIREVAWSGTHDVSLPTALALAQQLGRLSNQVVIWAMEASANSPAGDLSPCVLRVMPELFNQIVEELAHPLASGNQCTSTR